MANTGPCPNWSREYSHHVHRVEYKGTLFTEMMDVDVILACKPAAVLVDELAHTNLEGCNHPKRYQDVIDLLDAKIDVLSTVNV